jgi:hypothetical protein
VAKGKVRATMDFAADQKIVHKGDLFDGSDAITKGRDALFEPVEAASAEPGEKRASKPPAKPKATPKAEE